MRSVLFIAALLAAPVATAQLTLGFRGVTGTSVQLDKADCSAATPATVTYAFVPNGTVCSSLTLWISAGTGACANLAPTDSATTFIIKTVTQAELGTPAARTGEVPLSVRMLPPTNGGTPDCNAPVEQRYRVCGHVENQPLAGTCTRVAPSDLTLSYDTKPPAPPVLAQADVKALDGSIRAGLASPGDDVESFRIYVRRVDSSDGGTAPVGEPVASDATGVSGVADVRVGTAGGTYDVFTRTADAAGNESGDSNTVQVTMLVTRGFLDVYDENGEETGGCTASGGTLAGAALLALAGLLIARNRRAA